MDTTSTISTRWRLFVPVAIAGAALFRQMSVSAQDEGRQKASDAPGVSGKDQLNALLARIPATVMAEGDAPWSITFADMAAQLAAGGITPPDSIDDDEGMHLWINASFPIALAEPMRRYARVLNRALIGFDVTDLDQTLEAGAPPTTRTLLRGRFDQAAVAAAWERNGYKLLDVDGVAVASLFEDGELDVNNEISKIALARMNNAAFLPDGTLAYAPTLALLTEMISVSNGQVKSMAQNDEISALLASLDEPLVSAIFFSGVEISVAAQVPPDLMTAEIEELLQAPKPMPPISLGLVGITAGGPTIIPDEGEEPPIDFPAATIVFRLLMTEPGSAGVATTVAEARLETMLSTVTNQPYSEIYGSWEASAASDGDVLALDLLPAEGRSVSIWTRGLYTRDLLFLAW